MSNIEVVGLGALNVDHLYKVERLLDDGETVVKEAQSFPGGSAANTIYGLARLGVRTGFVGAVSDDAEGTLILHDFQKVGVDSSHIGVKQGTKTGAVLCLSDRAGRRSLSVMPGANNLLTDDDLDITYINQAGLIHLSSFVHDRQFRMLLGLITRLEPSTRLSFAPGALYAARGLTALAPILSRTHVLFINEGEIQQLTGKDFKAGAETCLEQGCHIVAITLGRGKRLDRGGKKVTAIAYIRDADSEHLIEPAGRKRLAITDTTGAGDAFAAGFLYGLLKGKALDECGQMGGLVAQFSITKMGARQGLPTLDELAQRYPQLYNKQL